MVDNQLRIKYFHSYQPGDYCLDSLKVTNLKTGRELKKCRFFYLWKGSTSRFLQQVEISGEGNYRMEYYNEDQTPPYLSLIHSFVVSPACKWIESYLLDTVVETCRFTLDLPEGEYEWTVRGLNSAYESRDTISFFRVISPEEGGTEP